MTIDRTEIVSLRYHLWLKRRWWLAPAVGILAAALFYFALKLNGFESSVSFAPVTNSAVLQASGLEGDTIAKAVPLSADAAGLASKSTLARANETAGGGISVEVLYNVQDDRIDVTVFGPTVDAVEKGKAFYINELISTRSKRYESASGAFVQSLSALRDSLNDRIATINQQVQSLPADSPGEVTAALLNELGDLNRQLRETQVRIDALVSLPGRSEEIAVVASSNDVVPRSGRFVVIMAIGIFAALCVLVIGYLKAMLDHKLRSESDVALSLGASMPVVHFNADSEIGRLASILQGMAKTHDKSAVAIVGVESSADSARIATQVSSELGDSATIAVAGSSSQDGVAAALASDRAVVLHAVKGSTTSQQLRRLADEMAIAGITPAAILLEYR